MQDSGCLSQSTQGAGRRRDEESRTEDTESHRGEKEGARPSHATGRGADLARTCNLRPRCSMRDGLSRARIRDARCRIQEATQEDPASFYSAVQLAEASTSPRSDTVPLKVSALAMGPTPAGVPVITMSPSFKVMKVFSSHRILEGLYIIWLESDDCTVASLISSWTANGPSVLSIGAKSLKSAEPSNDFERSHGKPCFLSESCRPLFVKSRPNPTPAKPPSLQMKHISAS